MSEMIKYNIPTKSENFIKVIGVGGGGGNAVASMFEAGIIGVDFAICNTDAQAMEHSPIQKRIQLGPNLTEGRGAGSQPERGKDACIESISEIEQYLSEGGTKMLFVTAGMGGGTGTGAAPIIAKVAKDRGILTVGIVTLPLAFEGMRRRTQALEGLASLKKNVDAILVISNEKLKEMFGGLELSAAFKNADGVLTTAAKSIAEIITVPGLINVDFEDVNFVMKNSGVALMGYGAAEGADRAKNAINMALNSPLLEDNDIRGAKHILVNITSSDANEVTLDEVGEITSIIEQEAGVGTDVIWGNCINPAVGEKVTVTIIATGFEPGEKIAQKSKVVQTKEVLLENDLDTITDQFDLNDISDNANVIDFEDFPSTTVKTQRAQPVVSQRDAELVNQIRMADIKRRELMRDTTLPLDTPENKEQVERVPAYLRRNVLLEDEDMSMPKPKGNIASSVFVDREGTVIQTANSFTTEIKD
jgi:cell division protein FtsZ